MNDFASFVNSGSDIGKRVIIRSLKHKLSGDWRFGGTMNLVAIADENESSVDDVVRALEDISGVGDFKRSVFTGGMKASYNGGMIVVVVSGGKLRVEYS